MSFAGKVALVTGGGTGIGRAIALAFARAGATVVVSGRTPDTLEQTVKMVDDEGGTASAVTADIATDSARLVETVVSRHGGLHIAVNNAGVQPAGGLLAEISEEDWARAVDTNLTGTWRAMKHEIAHMKDHGGGVIVNVSSVLGTQLTIPTQAAYSVSKAGIDTLTKVAAREYIGAGIRINAISPGPIDTAMSLLPGETEEERDARYVPRIPAGRMGTTEDVASAVLWLASDAAGFLVGHDLVLDGGVTA